MSDPQPKHTGSTPCAQCQVDVRVDGLDIDVDLARVTCTSRLCQARHDWDDDRWAGAARMATARRRSGLVLTEVDLEALDRTGVPLPA